MWGRSAPAWEAHRHKRGQAMTEFALVAPILFFLLFGILEASFIMFSSGTVRLAAGSAARLGSQMGNRPNADTVMLGAVQGSGLTTRIYRLNWVEIRKQTLSGGVLVDTANVDHYDYSGGSFGACGPCTWAPAGRNVFEGTSDFMKVTLDWNYDWKSGALLGAPSVHVQTSYSIRLEPQELAP